MATIDADAHVVESERTWDFMDPSDAHLRPLVVTMPDGSGKSRNYWLIDGKIRNVARHPVGGNGKLDSSVMSQETEAATRASGRNMTMPVAFRHMEDVKGRLRHMDELGTDIQVLYSTIFTHRMADRPEVDVALCRSYNRWLADIWSQSEDRLRWAAVLPLTAMDEALKELQTAVENGACAASMRPIEGDMMPSNPYFFPLYEEASRLNVPIAFHIGNSNTTLRQVLSDGGSDNTFGYLRLMSVAAFHALIMKGIPEMFPTLRFGFLEASAQWVPFAIHDLKRRFQTRGRPWGDDVMRATRMYVGCQTDDDLPYILKYAGEDNLVIGTDYGHTDQSAELEALQTFRKQGQASPEVLEKILDQNARAFYNL